jgi:hypothetical protein
MRSGQMGGQFWSVFVECKSDGVPQLDDPTVGFHISRSPESESRLSSLVLNYLSGWCATHSNR